MSLMLFEKLYRENINDPDMKSLLINLYLVHSNARKFYLLDNLVISPKQANYIVSFGLVITNMHALNFVHRKDTSLPTFYQNEITIDNYLGQLLDYSFPGDHKINNNNQKMILTYSIQYQNQEPCVFYTEIVGRNKKNRIKNKLDAFNQSLVNTSFNIIESFSFFKTPKKIKLR